MEPIGIVAILKNQRKFEDKQNTFGTTVFISYKVLLGDTIERGRIVKITLLKFGIRNIFTR